METFGTFDFAGRVAKRDMEQKFCMKTLSKTKGQYCMYKKGNYPEGQYIALLASAL